MGGKGYDIEKALKSSEVLRDPSIIPVAELSANRATIWFLLRKAFCRLSLRESSEEFTLLSRSERRQSGQPALSATETIYGKSRDMWCATTVTGMI
jgi:hypothetical protein